MTDRATWIHTAHIRRRILLALCVIPAVCAALYAYVMMPKTIHPILGISLCILFAILFGWLSVGFWNTVAGCILLLRNKDKFSPLANQDSTLDSKTRTALLFPVYNEDINRVMSGIYAVLESLKKTEYKDLFDIFILSDSTSPDSWIQEEEAWYAFCKKEHTFGKVFYRHRRNNSRRKSGNIADFCRRWGAEYRYMVVFDADSILSGECIIGMVRSMEAYPHIGILQTMPRIVNASSFIARMQQFSNWLYGPIMSAGLHFWQLGDAQFWGHNAIIRTEAFMQHCQLPILPGRPPLGGVIFSHDIVEAALMCRAGHEVWLTQELKGSYEESPPSLLDELIRARRWCQGNLQHTSLIFAEGFPGITRMLFVNGIMFYASALLWLGYLVFSSIQAMIEAFIIPAYFPDTRTLFPELPDVSHEWTLPLFICTLILLFIPKFVSMLYVILSRRASSFGGVSILLTGVFFEVLVSTFLAPVRMLSHSSFVLCTLIGYGIGWNPQNRDNSTSWHDAIRFHWWHTCLGLIWGYFMWYINIGFFIWLSPIIIGLVFSIPLSVFTSRRYGGKIFASPSEINHLHEVSVMNEHKANNHEIHTMPHIYGFIRAVVVPTVHSLHISLLKHNRSNTPYRNKIRNDIIEKAVHDGPHSLNNKERLYILHDSYLLRELHHKIWELEDGPVATEWGVFH